MHTHKLESYLNRLVVFMLVHDECHGKMLLADYIRMCHGEKAAEDGGHVAEPLALLVSEEPAVAKRRLTIKLRRLEETQEFKAKFSVACLQLVDFVKSGYVEPPAQVKPP